MEAALPISAAVKPAPSRAKPITAAAPSVSLPLRFVVSGLLALCGGVAWLVAQPGLLTAYHYNQHIIALTHLFVLGWICTVVMGAMYQLVPVALETRLYSERLAKWQFALHVVGFTGMVWMFGVWNMKNVAHFGSVLAVGVALFVYNLGRTLMRVRHWNVVATGIASSLFWFSFTVLAGLSIAAGKCTYESAASAATPGTLRAALDALRALGAFMSRFDAISAMHAHAHLGVIGLFTMLIVGVSYKLVPMFALSEIQSRRRAAFSLALLNAGLLGAFLCIITRSPWKFGFALLVCGALAIYGWEMRAIVRARKRATLDWGVRSFLTSLGLLVPVAAVGLVLAWPRLPLNVFTGQLENLYGFLALMGFVTFAIIGMLHKILPFLVWFHTYSPHVGRARVPNLSELYSERLQVAGYWAWLAGLAFAGAGILWQSPALVRVGALALAATLACLAINVARMLAHALHPLLKPFPAAASK